MVTSFCIAQQSILKKEEEEMEAIANATAKSIENYIEGSITATQLMLETPSFQASLNHYLESGNAGDLEQCVYAIAAPPAIREVALYTSRR